MPVRRAGYAGDRQLHLWRENEWANNEILSLQDDPPTREKSTSGSRYSCSHHAARQLVRTQGLASFSGRIASRLDDFAPCSLPFRFSARQQEYEIISKRLSERTGDTR